MTTRLFSSFCALGLASLCLTGCGMGTISHTSKDVQAVTVGSIHGIIHGGPNPISGATVTLYETQVTSSTTYGSTAKVLNTTTTDTNGNFTFDNSGANAYTCDTAPYMQYAYLTVTGGNTGTYAVNNNAVLMAAIGACSNLATTDAQNGTTLLVNEATTVAAAYALDNFIAVSGTAGAQRVDIGSPAENDSVAPGCDGSGSAMSCIAGGLGHAFANAAELNDAVRFAGNGSPTGIFNTTVPSFPGSIIPQAMLNVVADALQSCVNSAGGTGNCATLFADTTPSGGTAPTDTLSVAMNIAKYPATATMIGSSGIFGLSSGTSFFQPTVMHAPSDYSLAIVFPANASFPNAWGLATDISDNVYILAADSNKTGTTTTSGLAALGYNDSGQTSILYPYTTNSGSDSSYTYTFPGNVVVDGAGSAYISNVGSDVTSNRFRQFDTATGAFTRSFSPAVSGAAVLYPDQMAVDRSNNLWTVNLSQTGTISLIYEVPTTGAITNYSGPDGTVTGGAGGSGGLRGIAIDGNQNVWSCPAGKNVAKNPSQFAVFPNSGGTAGTTIYLSTLNNTTAIPLGANVAINGSNAAFCATNTPIGMATAPTDTNGVVDGAPAVSTTTPATTSKNTGAEIDGDGTYFQIESGATGNILVTTTTGSGATFAATVSSLTPCLPATTSGILYCSNDASSSPSYDVTAFPTAMQIDSTGSIWISTGTASAYSTGYTTSASNIVQIIGAAAPTWPQLSYGHPGLRPAPITATTPEDTYQAAGTQFLDQLSSATYLPSTQLYAENITSATGQKGSTAYLWTTDNLIRAFYWAAQVDPKYKSNLASLIAATSWYLNGPGYGTVHGGERFFDDNALLSQNVLDTYLNVIPDASILNEALFAENYVYSNRDAQNGIPQTEAGLGQGNFYCGPALSIAIDNTNYGIATSNSADLAIGLGYFNEVTDPSYGLDLIKPTGLYAGGTTYDSATSTWTPSSAGSRAGDNTHIVLLALAQYKATGQTSYLTFAENLMTLTLNKFYTPGEGVSEISVWGGYGIVDALCQLYMADHNTTWYNDAKDIVNFLLNDARDTAGYFPDTTDGGQGNWNIIRTGQPPDATVTTITQAAAAAAILEFAYTDLHQ